MLEDETIDLSKQKPKSGLYRVLRRTRSPLTIKIVAFNLVALSLLVTGILFLNQSRDGLINLREKTLVADARVLANAIESELLHVDVPNELNQDLAETLSMLAKPIKAYAQLYSADALPINYSTSSDDQDDVVAAQQTLRNNSVDDIFSDAWKRLSSVFSRSETFGQRDYLVAFRTTIARNAIFTKGATVSTTVNSLRQQITIAAVPVVFEDTVIGAVVLSTQGGEIDGYVRDERQQILEVFLLAILTSTFLSVVLANTIGRPLRILTEAAQQGGVQNTEGFNPGRIKIPDLTDRPDEIGELSRQLRNMTDALYDRIEANASFAADVAHEIKNPLTSLGSAVETMQYAKTEEAREKLLNVIRDDVRRMDRLVTDISNASRLDAELAKDDMQLFDLGKLLDNLAEHQRDISKDRDIEIRTNLPNPALKLPGIESRLAQVFVNLISNAVSFVPEGGYVEITAKENDDGNAEITVEDTGCGIPEDNLKDIFKRFYSSRPEQEFGNNSGLGLAISKQIVDAHGGRIWAENVYGEDDEKPKGARFTVTLPI